jgi:hypothetical protein
MLRLYITFSFTAGRNLTNQWSSSQVLKAATYNRKDASNRYITSYVNFGGDRSLGGFDCGA